jgi:DNA-binding transcriptional regulator YiaG
MNTKTATRAQNSANNPLNIRIVETVNRLNLSDTQAADYFGVPVFTVRKWLNGQRVPNAAVMRLLDVLGLVETLAPEIHFHLLPTGKRKQG